MLPAIIVGSVIVGSEARPFVLDVATGKVTLDRYREADPLQAQMAPEERGVSEKQVRSQVAGAGEIRLGAFRCPRCRRWVDVVRDPDGWNDDRCARC